MYYFGKSSSLFIEWLGVKTGLKAWIENMQNGLLGFLFAFGGLILWLIMMLFYFSLFKYIWLIVGSPVFAFLSEKTVTIMQQKELPFEPAQLIKDIRRGILLAFRNTLWQSVYTIAIILLSLIPIIGWPSPVLAIFVECYYYGFSMLDYSCEREKISASESIYFISAHKGLAVGNGMIFYLMHLLPIVGWVLAPSYAVIAATISLQELKQSAK